MKLTDGLHRSAHLHPDGVATVFGERRQTWSELIDRVARFAGALAACGLKPGDRVYVIASNSDRYIEYYFGVLWAGGVVVPGNTRWAAPEHRYSIEDVEPALLILDNQFAAMRDALAFSGIAPVILMDDGPAPDGLLDYEEMIATHDPIEDRCRRDDALAGIFYTGGTTGRSKGVMLSHRSILMSYLISVMMRPVQPRPIFLHSLPMFHLADAGMLFGVTLEMGTHVVMGQFSVGTMMETIAREKVGSVTLVPTIFAMIAEYVQTRPVDLSSVRRVTYGAAPISTALLRTAMDLFPNADFTQSYGQTELSPVATILESAFHDRSGTHADKLRSAGRPPPLVEIQIWDDQHRPVATGQIGEIAVNSPGRMLGYWNLPEQTADTLVDGWVRTGDAGYLDENGFLFVVDRVKDMIISGGENIYCSEVENALASHQAIQECAVIGVPDSKWGERVHAVIRLKAGHQATSEDIIGHVRSLIAGYKCPRTVEFVSEPLPLSGAGKILKSEIRRPYWEGERRGVN